MRKLHLKKACEALPDNGSQIFEDLYESVHISKKLKLTICKVQKVASTFLSEILRIYQNTSFPRLIPIQNVISGPNFKKRFPQILGYEKVMFVREPYGRLFSGYVDKMFSYNPPFWNYIYSFGKLSKGSHVDFTDFVTFILNINRKNLNCHFSPIYSHCNPCSISYDFIGTIETMQNDTLYLIKEWNKKFRRNVTFSDFVKESDIQNAMVHIRGIFAFDKSSSTKYITLHEALLRAWRTLQIRGILPIAVDLPFNEDQTKNITKDIVFQAAKDVIENVKDRSVLKAQRKEALMEAYSLLSMDLKNRLEKFVEMDCRLFGYDSRPSYIFNSSSYLGKRKYFTLDFYR